MIRKISLCAGDHPSWMLDAIIYFDALDHVFFERFFNRIRMLIEENSEYGKILYSEFESRNRLNLWFIRGRGK